MFQGQRRRSNMKYLIGIVAASVLIACAGSSNNYEHPLDLTPNKASTTTPIPTPTATIIDNNLYSFNCKEFEAYVKDTSFSDAGIFDEWLFHLMFVEPNDLHNRDENWDKRTNNERMQIVVDLYCQDNTNIIRK